MILQAAALGGREWPGGGGGGGEGVVVQEKGEEK